MRPKSSVLAPAAMLALALALWAPPVRGDDPDPDPDLAPPRFTFSGFGTLGVVHSSEGQADFTSTIFKPDGAGHTRAWSPQVDSLIAGQATGRITSKLMAAVQVISEQKYDGTYWPHVEWASLKYQFTPDFSVRLGRTVLPVFMVTDARKVGYANPWVRPPVEVYGLVPITTNDGADLSLRSRVRGMTNTLQVTAGRSDARFPNGGGDEFATAKARESVTVVDTVERGFATVRLNYGRTRFTIPEFRPLFDAFRQFGPEGAAIAERYDVRDRPVEFVGVGASYDPGRWFVMAEWGRVRIHTLFGQRTGWYVSGGHRIRKAFTIHVTYASAKVRGSTSDPGLTVSALPPPLAETAAGLNGALNSLLSNKVVQNTISVGGRWDLTKSAALTLQLDRSDFGEGSAGPLMNLQPGFERGG
ncbi:MAG TPA: hypothetical protein VI669_06155, partial [Vicinamibacteria bacterium]